MKDYIEERAVEIADYIIENNATVRADGEADFGSVRVRYIKMLPEPAPSDQTPPLPREARKVLDMNKSERHIQGRDGYKREVSSSAWIRITDREAIYLCFLNG